ncbi:MAG: hypothetical protein JW774_08245 [Candidatus Aureabacteria bacterium]|nr:hypothetical protein [Candidatus Auribacterota bacterium]
MKVECKEKRIRIFPDETEMIFGVSKEPITTDETLLRPPQREAGIWIDLRRQLYISSCGLVWLKEMLFSLREKGWNPSLLAEKGLMPVLQMGFLDKIVDIYTFPPPEALMEMPNTVMDLEKDLLWQSWREA